MKRAKARKGENMDLIDEIIAIGALAFFMAPFLVILGVAAYYVYSPKFNDYDVIEQCKQCSHKAEPYSAACWRCKYNPLYWEHKKPIYTGPGYITRIMTARKWRNDMQPNTATCRSCGAQIVWKKTASGKMMPCEAFPIDIIPRQQSKFKALDKYGKLIPCEKADGPGDLTEVAWEPHWANCPGADNHRRR